MSTLCQLVDEFQLLGTSGLNKLNEADHLFSRADEFEIDPDRTDIYDIVHALLPSLVKMAYTFLYQDKEMHARHHGEDDPDERFEFTQEALRDQVQELIQSLVKRLDDVTYKDIDEQIERLTAEFKHPLTPKK